MTDTAPSPVALVLAAGRGLRMRPLTDQTPKPLLTVRGVPLMQLTMDALMEAGVRRYVVNTAWLGERVEAHTTRWAASRPGVTVALSREGMDFGYALETAGGIARALPLLGDVFWVLAGDVYAPDFPFDPEAVRRFEASGRLAHLWLVPNPPHHPQGDFGIGPDGLAHNGPQERLTFSTIALYRRAMFELPWCDIPAGNPQGTAAALAPLLRRAIDAGRVSADRFDGTWVDVGTPERLAALNG